MSFMLATMPPLCRSTCGTRGKWFFTLAGQACAIMMDIGLVVGGLPGRMEFWCTWLLIILQNKILCYQAGLRCKLVNL